MQPKIPLEPMRLEVTIERWPRATEFRIAYRTTKFVDVVVVSLERHGHVGQGEAAGVFYLNEDVTSIRRQIEDLRQVIENGIDRNSLLQVLPRGGARNALDCALWDLDAKLAGRRAWEIAGLDRPTPIITTFTCGADSPVAMAENACSFAKARAIKLKLTGDPIDADRIRAVRESLPNTWLGIDANQSFSVSFLETLMPVLVEAGVAAVEQPFPIGQESLLDGFESPIPIVADESAQQQSDLQRLVGRFSMVNIKLDKCGGLTAALMMVRRARALGLGAMVGHMGGTSLAMAPAFLIAQFCDIVDLDGPALLKSDRAASVRYDRGFIDCPEAVWGGPSMA